MDSNLTGRGAILDLENIFENHLVNVNHLINFNNFCNLQKTNIHLKSYHQQWKIYSHILSVCVQCV